MSRSGQLQLLGSEEALRKAYSDRMRNIGRKLQEGSVAGKRRGRASTGDLHAVDGDQEVDALVQRIRTLCKERQDVRRQTEETDRRNETVVRELQAQLMDAQQQHAELGKEKVRLQQLMVESGQEQESENSKIERLKGDRLRSLEHEAEKLNEANQLVLSHLRTIQVEAADYRSRVAQLSQEHVVAHDDATAAAAAQNAARQELEGLWDRVRQSEMERQELEEKYAIVGRRFEHAIEASEKENLEASQTLKSEAHSLKKKAEKQKRKVEDAKARLADAQRAAAQQSAAMHEREIEIQRLRDLLQQERDTAMRQEEQFYENQRRVVQEQALELQKMGASMPMAAHQKILKEQGEYYRASMRELEETLRQRLKAQEETLRRELKMQDDALRQQQHVQEQQQHRLRTQQQMLQQHERDALLEVEKLQDESAGKCQLLEIELKEAHSMLAQAQAEAVSVEEQRRVLASNLETSTRRLAYLRDILEVERQNKLKTQEGLIEAREQLAELRKAIAAVDVELEPEVELKANQARLEAQLTNQQAALTLLKENVSQLRDAGQAASVKLVTIGTQRGEGEKRLKDAQCRIRQLEDRKQMDSRAIRKKHEALCRIKPLLKGHADLLRRSIFDLRNKLQEECRMFAGELNVWAQQWHRACAKSLDKVGSKSRAARELVAAADRTSEDLKTRLAALQATGASLRESVEQARHTSGHSRPACDQIRSTAQNAAMNAERVIRAIEAALPNGLPDSITQALFAAVGAGDGDILDSASKRSSVDSAKVFDVFGALGAELKQSFEAAKNAAAKVEKSRMAEILSQRQADRDESVRGQKADISARQGIVDAEIRALTVEMNRLTESGDRGELGGVDNGDVPTAQKCAKEEAALREQEAHVQQLDSEIAVAEEAAERAQQRVLAARAALDDQSVEMSLATEEAQREARAPLEREVREAKNQLDALRSSLRPERQRREAEWQEHCKKVRQQQEAEKHKAQATLREESLLLDQEIERIVDAQAKGLQERESSIFQINTEIASTLQSIEDAEEEQRHLISARDSRQRQVKRLQDSLSKIERRISETTEASRRDEQDAEEDERQLIKSHEEAVARVRRQRESEIARLESAVQESLGNLSAELSTDGDAALLAHSELRATAERLADRARSQLEREFRSPRRSS